MSRFFCCTRSNDRYLTRGDSTKESLTEQVATDRQAASGSRRGKRIIPEIMVDPPSTNASASTVKVNGTNPSVRVVTFQQYETSITNANNTFFSEKWVELSDAFSYGDLVVAANNIAPSIVSNLLSVSLFMLTPDTGEIELYSKIGCMGRILPRSGIVEEVLKDSRPYITMGIPSSDPIYSILDIPRMHVRQNSKHAVVMIPLKHSNKNYGCCVILGDSDRRPKLKDVLILQKYLTAAARRVVKHETEKYEHARADNMLKFCVELYQMNSTNLIETILQQVLETTDASFTGLIVPDEQELVIHVFDGGYQLENMTIDLETSMYRHLLAANKPENLGNITKHPKYNPEIDSLTGRELQTMICLPLYGESKCKTQSMVCAFNKKGLKFNTFTKGDEDALAFTMKFCAPILSNALSFERQLSSRERTQALLKVAQNLFTRFDSVNVLLREIMQEARTLTQAESCSVFLVDKVTKELVAKVFDGTLVDDEIGTGHEIRIPINKGIAGHVAMTGKLLNIKDAYSHPLFYRGVDEDTGFITRNILCFPIKDDTGVIGIAQLCNKINGKCFTRHDEEAALSFSVYCGISISNSLLFKKVQDAQYRSKLASDLMIYHMQVPQSEVDTVAQEVANPCEPPTSFPSLLFPTYIIDEESKSVSLAYYMFDDLGLITRWSILPQTLIRFLLMVKRGYRDPPYHNWMHAFCVGHFFYALAKSVRINDFFTENELLSMLIACFCHDLDHRGTTNAFQVASKSVLACLYSSEGSVMERHHFAQTLCILNTAGCNALEGLATAEYKEALDNINTIILATDLAQHLRIIAQQKEMATNGYDYDNPRHHFLLLSLVVTSCDLSVNVKMFEESSVIVRDHIYTEFFSEGDMEKQLGRTPNQQNDRQKACIPQLQCKFSDFIAAPLYKLLLDIFPESKLVNDQLEENRIIWGSIATEHGQDANHNCIKYDTYISCKQSQQNIAKKLTDYANKLNTRNVRRVDSKNEEFEKIAADWNKGLTTGDSNRTREHVSLISEYNEALMVPSIHTCDMSDLGRAFNLGQSSDDMQLKRRLYMSQSSPPTSSSPGQTRSISQPGPPRPVSFHNSNLNVDEIFVPKFQQRSHSDSVAPELINSRVVTPSSSFRLSNMPHSGDADTANTSTDSLPTFDKELALPDHILSNTRETRSLSSPDHSKVIESLLTHGREEWI